MTKRKTTKLKARGRRTKRLSVGKQTLRDLDPRVPGLKGGAKNLSEFAQCAARGGRTIACAV